MRIENNVAPGVGLTLVGDSDSVRPVAVGAIVAESEITPDSPMLPRLRVAVVVPPAVRIDCAGGVDVITNSGTTVNDTVAVWLIVPTLLVIEIV